MYEYLADLIHILLSKVYLRGGEESLSLNFAAFPLVMSPYVRDYVRDYFGTVM